MKFTKGKLEEQARCPHEYRSKETIMGQKTGDKVCNECGEIFMPKEEVTPVPYRKHMIMTAHALLIALKANKDLELKQNVKGQGALATEYDWALVHKETGEIIVPVAHDVAVDCTEKGYC